MSEVGALIIKLRAETAQFREDMGKVKHDLDDLHDKGGRLDKGFELAEAKGSMMLFEESVGVRLPRHLNALIAQIPGIGMAFQLMLPVAGVVAAIDIITKLIEKHDEAKRKALEQKEAWAALSEKIRTGADELQVANDKLRDAIAVFDGKPKNNVKLALDEAVVAADKLYDSLAKDIQELSKLMDKQDAGFWQKFMGSAEGAADEMRPLLDAVNKARDEGEKAVRAARDSGDAKKLAVAQDKASLDIQNAIGNALTKNNELLADSTRIKQLQDDFKSGKKSGSLDETTEAFKGGDQSKRVDSLTESARQLTGELDRAKLGATNLSLSLTHGLEDPLKSAKALSEAALKLTEIQVEGINKHQAALLKLVATQDAMKAEGNKNPDTNIDSRLNAQRAAVKKEHDAEIADANRVFDGQKSVYEKAAQVAGITAADKQQLAAKFANDQTALSDRIAQADAEASKRGVAAKVQAENEKLKAVQESVRAEQELSASTYRLEQDRAKASVSLARESIKNKATLGLISKSEEVAALTKLDQDELDALKKAYAKEESALQDHLAKMQDAQRSAKGTTGEAEAIRNSANAQRQLNEAQAQFIRQSTQLQGILSGDNTAAARLASSWKNYFASMKKDTDDLSTKVRVELQGSVSQFTRSFGDSMAKCIVENKSLGQAVQQEAMHMAESMISMLVQWLEKWIITHTLAAALGVATDSTQKAAAASLAGANMVASWAAAPWPIDTLAPAMGAQAFAAAMAFEKGGEIPGAGAVPIIAHGGETVVTRALTERVAASEGKSGNSYGDSHQHVTYAPQIHAVDADGVDRMLQKHGERFHREFTRQMRRRNQ